ncbi:UvrD-helicase domain-containing protein [Aurantimonas aggregata]|uniref:DNA 3'-5' helicase n=1 Tax=Aurantimonas aggregata TaxID=2047720 RepID=A0A6L9MKE4_9HYPH|nr:ATP-dependent helicase [Aurantimonas aggregata]NDV88329.1 UvrD-helicase domain-containing protein [Aurantimonas aggregata]
MAWSDGLDPATPAHQIAASINSRVRVVAGPGTGKSFAMKRRVARLLESGTAPSSILPVTFTRVAAEDLHRELTGMGVPGCNSLQGVTLHSLALRILMRNHVLGATGRVPRPLNEFELKPLICDLMGAHGGKRAVDKLKKAYEAAWARLQHHQPGYALTPADAAFQADLLAWLKFHESMLIGEVIPQLHQYLHSNPAAGERNEFRHILVDEYQDLNRAEQGVVELLSGAAEVCIVGDDDQSIYSFKHAHPDGIREWLNVNAGADDIGLDDCRRCPTRVVEMANSLIRHNVQRPVPRPLNPMPENGVGDVRIIQYQTLRQEVSGVSELVSQMIARGTPAGDILVLTQSRAFGTPLYESLVERGVPTKSYYAESELSHDDAQRAFALLKLFVNREDRVALRWLVGVNGSNWHASGYRRIREHCETSGISPWEAMTQLERGGLRLPYTGGILDSFRGIVEALGVLEALPDLHAIVNLLFPDGQNSTRDIRLLSLAILDTMVGDDREEFLRELVAAIAQPEIPTEIEDVRIMSLHKSKGLSSPATIIAGCVQGLLPRPPEDGMPPAEHARHLEEQRRLFYVGITRVKAAPQAGKPGTLILTYSQRMPVRDALSVGITPARQQYGEAILHASQFIRELGASAPDPIAG